MKPLLPDHASTSTREQPDARGVDSQDGHVDGVFESEWWQLKAGRVHLAIRH